MTPRNDHFWIGLLVAIVVPFIAYALLLQLTDYFAAGAGRTINFTERTMALIAICVNLLPMNVFRRTYRNKSLRGLVTGTVGLGLVWFFYFGRALL